MSKIRLQVAIMSHLSNAQQEIFYGLANKSNNSITFAKVIILTYSDITQEVDTEELDNLFYKTFNPNKNESISSNEWRVRQ